MSIFKINLKKRDNLLFLHEDSFVVLQHTKGRQAHYALTIESNQNVHSVVAEYGKIGTNLKKQKICNYDSIKEARVFFNKKVQEKLVKGYEIITSKT